VQGADLFRIEGDRIVEKQAVRKQRPSVPATRGSHAGDRQTPRIGALRSVLRPDDGAALGPRSDYAPTYWIGTAGPAPEDDGPVTGDMDVDVVVIGSGYTGLSCAIHLAKLHGIRATVLEANGVAYGCSTRNGGQAQISFGRLKRSQWIARWGLEGAKGLHGEAVEGFELFRGMIRDHEIACEPQDGGHYYIAHKASVTSPTRRPSCRRSTPRPRCCATPSATARGCSAATSCTRRWPATWKLMASCGNPTASASTRGSLPSAFSPRPRRDGQHRQPG
jgi:hypothetical protein